MPWIDSPGGPTYVPDPPLSPLYGGSAVRAVRFTRHRRVGIRHCSRCGQAGHNKATCARRQAQREATIIRTPVDKRTLIGQAFADFDRQYLARVVENIGPYADEATCAHGIGHPIPGMPHHGNGIHGCDGCCATRDHEAAANGSRRP